MYSTPAVLRLSDYVRLRWKNSFNMFNIFILFTLISSSLRKIWLECKCNLKWVAPSTEGHVRTETQGYHLNLSNKEEDIVVFISLNIFILKTHDRIYSVFREKSSNSRLFGLLRISNKGTLWIEHENRVSLEFISTVALTLVRIRTSFIHSSFRYYPP